MRVLLLGAAGFLGTRLAARLAAQGHVGSHTIDELVLFDARPLPAAPAFTGQVTTRHGDLREAAVLDALFAHPVDVVFHLAASLTLQAEREFRQGLETNVLAFVALLERCRAQSTPPRMLFASSISTFGGALPDVVDDDVFQAPTTTYGTHKVVAEQLLADYSRHGFVDGRALRLPIVMTHPGPASGSISDQVAALVREPLRGATTPCRMAPDSRMAVASAATVVAAFLHLAGLPAEALQGSRIMNLPGLTVTPMALVEAAARHRPSAREAVQWQPDAEVQRIIEGWPRAFTSRRALALGLRPDASADAIVADFLAAEAARP